MKFMCPLIVVENMAVSREFYEKLLGQKVLMDFGANISFEDGLSLQTKETWIDFISKKASDIKKMPNDMELYFEEVDFDNFITKLRSEKGISLVHDVREYPWGQRVVRFYDPDKHIIEVGESMVSVIKGFLNKGMSIEEASERSQHPVEFVKQCL